MPEQSEVEKFIRELGHAVDKIIQDELGEHTAFSIFLWPKTKEDRANFISNVSTEAHIEALETAIKRLENNDVDPPNFEDKAN